MGKGTKTELTVIDFTKFSVAQLPELKGKKEEIASIIKANPIVEIVDNATYESAKKSRTAVKTLRTGLEKEQKDVKKKIKELVLDVVDKEYDTLVLGVKSAEQSRQEPIDVWEEKKEQERQEKAHLEQERIDGIKSKISIFFMDWSAKIGSLQFADLENFEAEFKKSIEDYNRNELQEFEVLFDDSLSNLTYMFSEKKANLIAQEKIRIDNLVIEEKNSENRKIQSWQNTWNANINSLVFDDISDVKKSFRQSKLEFLKHYTTEYDEIYSSTEKRLHSQIEFISKAEEQRIAKEKFDKDKADFEAKQLEAKFQERKKYLIELGMIDDEKERLVFQDYELKYSHIKQFNEPNWNEIIEFIHQKISESKSEKEFQEEPISGGVYVGPSKVVSNIYNPADVSDTEVVFEDVSQKSVEPIVEFDLPKEEDSVIYSGVYKNLTEDFASFELKFFIKDLPKFEHLTLKEFLKDFNIPTKKQ